MLLKRQILDGIVEGRISLAFRRWKRPTVKKDGRLRTVVGELAIDDVRQIDPATITNRDAMAAGFESRKKLLAELNSRSGGEIYRVAVHYAGADPRRALRNQDTVSDEESAEVEYRLLRMDSRSSAGPWTRTTLTLIAKYPGRRAPELADEFGMETKRFKTNVRKLKELGLTESLQVGYRLSPRGQVVFDRLAAGKQIRKKK